MARYRTHTIEFKRQVAEEHLCQGTSLNQLARRHDISRELLRIWVRKYEAGELASNGPGKADRRGLEAKGAGLERKGGQLTMGLGLRQKGWPRHDGRAALVPASRAARSLQRPSRVPGGHELGPE